MLPASRRGDDVDAWRRAGWSCARGRGSRVRVSIVIAATYLALLAEPDSEELPTVATDRPDATNGTNTVMPGVWKLEAGIDAVPPQRGGDPDTPPLGVPMTLRIGVADHIELRLFDGDPLPWLDARGRGGGGVSLGAKVRVLDVVHGRRLPSLGVQPYISFPSYHPRSWRDATLGLIGLWTQPLTAWLAFDANASLEVGVPGGSDATLGSLLSVSMQVIASHRFIPYAEVYGLVDWLSPRGSVVAVDAGLVMVAARRLSFDVAGRVDVVAEQPEYGLLAGVAVILSDGIRWRSRVRRRPNPR